MPFLQGNKKRPHQKQLDDANKEIQSYKDMDIEGVKKSAKEWEEGAPAGVPAGKPPWFC